MVIHKIIRTIDKGKNVASLSVLETMFMLKNSWDKISEKTIQKKFFCRAEISAHSEENAMDENDDPLMDEKSNVTMMIQ